MSEVEVEERYEDDDGDVDWDGDRWDYDRLEYWEEDADGLIGISTLVFIFTLIGIILTFCFLVLGFLTGFRLIPGWIPLIVGLGASLCIIAGPVCMMIMSPSAWRDLLGDDYDDDDEPQDGPWKSFWGSDKDSYSGYNSESSWDNSWGPYWAWYTTLVLGISMIGLSLFCIGIKRRRLSYYGRFPYGPPGGYQHPHYDDPHRGPPSRAHDDRYNGPPGRAYDDPYGHPRNRAHDTRERPRRHPGAPGGMSRARNSNHPRQGGDDHYPPPATIDPDYGRFPPPPQNSY